MRLFGTWWCVLLWQWMSCEHPRQRRIRKLVDLGGCLYLFLNALVCFVLLRETPKLLTQLAKNMFCDSFFKCLRVLSTSQKYPEAQKMLTPPSQNHFFCECHRLFASTPFFNWFCYKPETAGTPLQNLQFRGFVHLPEISSSTKNVNPHS